MKMMLSLIIAVISGFALACIESNISFADLIKIISVAPSIKFLSTFAISAVLTVVYFTKAKKRRGDQQEND